MSSNMLFAISLHMLSKVATVLGDLLRLAFMIYLLESVGEGKPSV